MTKFTVHIQNDLPKRNRVDLFSPPSPSAPPLTSWSVPPPAVIPEITVERPVVDGLTGKEARRNTARTIAPGVTLTDMPGGSIIDTPAPTDRVAATDDGDSGTGS